MRKIHNTQTKFSGVNIENIKLDRKYKDDVPAVLQGIQHLYKSEKFHNRLFAILKEKVLPKINKKDLQYFKEILPAIYKPSLDQVPTLAPQTALVLGECIPFPTLIKISEARMPRSHNPRFYQYWDDEFIPTVDVNGICEQWEGSTTLNDVEVTE